MPYTNRRQWPRYDKLHLIQFALVTDDAYKISSVVNFSCGGLCLIHREPLDEGIPVRIKLDASLAGSSKVIPASVKWCIPDSIGGYAIGLEYSSRLDWNMPDV